MRIESPHPMHNGGWFHPFEEDEKPVRRLVNPMKQPKPLPADFNGLMHAWRADTQPGELEAVVESLGVSAQSLRWLMAALTNDHQTLAVPMYDATDSFGENPCGIRLRYKDGRKLSVTTSKAGVFFPYGALLKIACRRVFVCEGPTDAAAGLDMGLFTVGRPSCRGQTDIVKSVLHQLGAEECVIVSDNDGPGLAGAQDLLKEIRHCRKMLFVAPQKDLRGFVREGGTKPILDAVISSLKWQ